MKINKGLVYSIVSLALLTACANESPFVDSSSEQNTGQLMTRCLAPKLTNVEGIDISTRAEIPSTDDFKVVISRKTKTRDGAGSVEYKYSDMPEVLTLPVGDYRVYAHHGDNKPSAWEEPYYYGSSEFGIDANKITDDVDPIVARLSNIRVTIVFHPSLLGSMSDDSKVEVRVGNQGVMTFKPTETRSAYFKYVDSSQTLAATFTGIVDGSEVVETHTHDQVAPGNHYRLTFRKHGIDDDKPGTVSGTISVDATVEQIDMNHTVDGEGEDYFTDDQRPVQGGKDDPNPPVGDKTAPQIYAMASKDEQYLGFDIIDLDKVNEVTDHLSCAWKVVSEAEGGFTGFSVDIDSETLTPEELDGVGVADHLDLIEPGEFEDALKGLGFPTRIGGLNEAEFDITGFLSLMTVLGPADHEFKMTVTDANGTSVFYLRLHTN
ncbi:MAG: DUF4493 domain-containing protein [Muribaculaceae bacterium]|nr:DUF4493 domain-containing protein [Muribaculaceae bacterium]